MELLNVSGGVGWLCDCTGFFRPKHHHKRGWMTSPLASYQASSSFRSWTSTSSTYAFSSQVCAFCDLELASTAYYRHRTDQKGSFCPGKRRKVYCTSDEESHLGKSSSGIGIDYSTYDSLEEVKALDSSFDLSEGEEQLDLGNHEEPFEDCDSSDLDDSQFSFNNLQVYNILYI